MIAQYRRLYRLQARIFDYPSREWPERFAEVATDPLLSNALTNLARMEAAGEVVYGAPVLRHPVAIVSGDSAIVEDCQDTSNFGRARKSTAFHLSVGVPEVHVVVTFERGSDGIWRAARETAGGAC